MSAASQALIFLVLSFRTPRLKQAALAQQHGAVRTRRSILSLADHDGAV
jgi:hypothetical protein